MQIKLKQQSRPGPKSARRCPRAPLQGRSWWSRRSLVQQWRSGGAVGRTRCRMPERVSFNIITPQVCRKDTVETYLTNGRCRSVEPCCSLQCQRIPGLLPRSQGLLVRLVAIGQDRAQHGSTRLLAHLVVLVRIVLGHVHGTHPTIQRRLLLLKLLECLSGLSYSDINADDISHREPCY